MEKLGWGFEVLDVLGGVFIELRVPHRTAGVVGQSSWPLKVHQSLPVTNFTKPGIYPGHVD